MVGKLGLCDAVITSEKCKENAEINSFSILLSSIDCLACGSHQPIGEDFFLSFSSCT